MFRNCSNLARIEITNNIKTIESDAFNGCASLDMVDIPTSVKQIESDAFDNCGSLMTVTSRSGIPPKIKKNSFSKQFQKDGVLYVPSPTAYRNNPKLPWSTFRNIEMIRR